MEQIIKDMMKEQIEKSPEAQKIIKEKIIETLRNIDTTDLSKEITSQIKDSIESFDYCDCLCGPFDKLLKDTMKGVSLQIITSIPKKKVAKKGK
jgi:hypothetical protein